MGDDTKLIEELRLRVRELENKVDALRVGRRVLMNLIEGLEAEKREQLANLTTQNERLQKNNFRYARAIMSRDVRINQLEAQLAKIATGKKMLGNTFT
ncbi:MAG: translation initiation factor 2 [Firmicutes bacterium]|nr:translation initiation factor 2 [Bacillota bacterium]